jgi:hypothetical protein
MTMPCSTSPLRPELFGCIAATPALWPNLQPNVNVEGFVKLLLYVNNVVDVAIKLVIENVELVDNEFKLQKIFVDVLFKLLIDNHSSSRIFNKASKPRTARNCLSTSLSVLKIVGEWSLVRGS